jgi:hypothetical protein
VSSQNRKIQDVPNVPIVGTPAVSVREDRSIDVPFTNPTPVTGGLPAQYRAVSTPGNFQGVSLQSPITVQGLTGGTSYTFQVRAETSTGANDGFTSASSTIVPQFGAMESIATVALAADGGINFTNIPQTFNDLTIVVNARSNFSITNAGYSMQFNNDGGSNYSHTYLQGDGSSATSVRGANQTITIESGIPGSSTTAGIFGSVINHILNYRSSANKTVLSRSAQDMNGSGNTRLSVNLWRNTAAISTITLLTSGSFVAGSTATLYGIRASI